MSYAFEPDDGTVEQGLRRIATEQIDKAVQEASTLNGEFDATVHRVRRRCKNLRGLLRIVRPGLKAFSFEDNALRAVASQLSHVRDAAVMLETFDGLVKDAPHDEGTAHLREMLSERNRALMLPMDQKTLLREFCTAMVDMRGRVGEWRLKRKRFGALADGIEGTYRLMQRRMGGAAADGAAVTMHAWRKQAKYHRHHIMLLHRHAPAVLDSRSKLLAELGDQLGQHHDLAVLIEVLTAHAAGRSAALEAIGALVATRQHKLAEQAFALGGQIAAEKPAALTDRLRRYWTLAGA